MAEVIRVAGRELVPIATGYAPHAYVFAVGEVTYRIGPLPDDRGYAVHCVTTEWEAEGVFGTLEAAVEHVNRRHGASPSPKRRHR